MKHPLTDTDIDRVRQLLKRFYEGETSLDEERELRSFFASNATSLPADLIDDARVIDLLGPTMPADSHLTHFAESYIDTLADATAQKRRHRKLRLLYPTLVAAAAIAAIFVIAPLRHPQVEEPVKIASAPRATAPHATPKPATVTSTPPTVVSTPVGELHSTPAVTSHPAPADTVPTREATYIEVTDTAQARRMVEQSLRMLAQQIDCARDASKAADQSLTETQQTLKKVLQYETENS